MGESFKDKVNNFYINDPTLSKLVESYTTTEFNYDYGYTPQWKDNGELLRNSIYIQSTAGINKNNLDFSEETAIKFYQLEKKVGIDNIYKHIRVKNHAPIYGEVPMIGQTGPEDIKNWTFGKQTLEILDFPKEDYNRDPRVEKKRREYEAQKNAENPSTEKNEAVQEKEGDASTVTDIVNSKPASENTNNASVISQTFIPNIDSKIGRITKDPINELAKVEKSGEMNYHKKVSLNVAPITKLNIANGMGNDDWKERIGYILGYNSSFLYKLFAKDWGIVFPYTPSVDFKYSASYETTDIMHSNISINHYKNTPPPTISLSADFTADGADNATYMYGVIHFLRAMTKCEFGDAKYSVEKGDDDNTYKVNTYENKYIGVPPPVLYLNGWGNYMDNIPVVITSFGVKFDKDKHYVQINVDGKEIWLPTMITISIELKIQFNLNKYKKQFNLNDYKKNILGYSGNTKILTKNVVIEEVSGTTITKKDDKTFSQETNTKGLGSRNSYSVEKLNGSGWTW